MSRAKTRRDAIREAAADLKLGEKGVTVRLTGSIPIADDEFATLKEGAALNGALTVFAVLIILWLALHSARIILAVFVSPFYRALRNRGSGARPGWRPSTPSRLPSSCFSWGSGSISACNSASATAPSVSSGKIYSARWSQPRRTPEDASLWPPRQRRPASWRSHPRRIRGFRSLAQSLGMGMIVAFIMSITVLPAMLRLLNPPAEPHPLGYAFLSPVDRFLERNRVPVLVITLCAVSGGLAAALLAALRFQSDGPEEPARRVRSPPISI